MARSSRSRIDLDRAVTRRPAFTAGSTVTPSSSFTPHRPVVAAAILDSLDAPTALLCADGFWRRGRPVPMLATARDAVARVPEVHTVIVAPRLSLPLDEAGATVGTAGAGEGTGGQGADRVDGARWLAWPWCPPACRWTATAARPDWHSPHWRL